MKIRLTFKSPDVLDQLTWEEAEASEEVMEKFLVYGEYLDVEFCTETLEATVIPKR